MTSQILSDLAHTLRKGFEGEIRLDPVTRALYSTDASIYQIEPLGVAFPQTTDDLHVIVEAADKYEVPILPRGSGSSLAGQAVGAALVIDCSRYLNRIVEIDPETKTALVQPGVVLSIFNAAAAKHGLQYGPDPASADRATFGGMLGNNSTGAHSILYGMTADNVIAVDAVLSDGRAVRLESIPLSQAMANRDRSGVEGRLYSAALDIREKYEDAIHERWPRTWRRSAGYSLNYLYPWSSSSPARWALEDDQGQALPYPPQQEGHINLAPLLVGSEGTLAVFKQARVRLVLRPAHTILGVLQFEDVAEACEATQEIMGLNPSAVELIPRTLIERARTIPSFAQQLFFVKGNPEAILVVEFSGSDMGKLKEQVRRLGSEAVIAESLTEQNQIWAVRKVGLGLLMSRPGDTKPLPFVEDIAVPIAQLPDYVREIEKVMQAHGTKGDFYAHASAGCLHIRPLVNLKSQGGPQLLRGIASDVVDLAIKFGGALSGEHGDGLARGEWLSRVYGPDIMAAFAELKQAADPKGILNPDKKVTAPRMDEDTRYTPEYRAKTWQPIFDFSAQENLQGAIEMCNGAGVCRKDGGVMCPSFQATRDEMHSTRGRANLLRAMISGHMPQGANAEKAVHQALDLCLECKGCQAECPSGVDMAKLKYEYLNFYYQIHRRPLRDYLFANIAGVAKFGRPFAPLANIFLRSGLFKNTALAALGISPQRNLPHFKSLSRKSNGASEAAEKLAEVIYLGDAFSEYFYPEISRDAQHVLRAAGCKVHQPPIVGAGRTLISKGFLERARKHAGEVVTAIRKIDPGGKMPVIAIEPSEMVVLKDEYLDFFPDDAEIAAIADRTYLIDEFLMRPGSEGSKPIERLGTKIANDKKTVHLHGHCHQKTQAPLADGFPSGVEATREMLSTVGYEVKVIESGCCGMAGSFGYEKEHHEVSLQIGELALFPAVRAAQDSELIAAAGVSCRAQIETGTGRETLHPISLVAQALKESKKP